MISKNHKHLKVYMILKISIAQNLFSLNFEVIQTACNSNKDIKRLKSVNNFSAEHLFCLYTIKIKSNNITYIFFKQTF